jgi:septum formation protein
MNQISEFVLASGSPRRKELLEQLGLKFSVLVTDIDETHRQGEPPVEYVRRMALEKAVAGQTMSGSELAVLGADTVVLLDDEILGKPCDREQAASMLARLSNREHLVLSAVAIVQASTRTEVLLNMTTVTFAEIPTSFIHRYCSTDEPLDKAGAYAIQAEPGIYVSRIEGSYSGVMGLPLYETGRLLEIAGVLF